MDRDQLFKLLDEFKIETPSWGYADTGTRFGKFLQPAAAGAIDEKLADPGGVDKYTGCCPSVGVDRQWGFFAGVGGAESDKILPQDSVKERGIEPEFFYRHSLLF